MCGIFGGIGKVNPGIIRALTLANRERGTDSLGFFNSAGKILKRAGDPLDILTDRDFQRYIDRAPRAGWFIAGHTRQATQGKVCTRNAHPFKYGRIIGAHNGIVDAPASYKVDSEYLIDLLNSADYPTALDKVAGYWGLSWYDGSYLYLQAHGTEIAIGQDKRGAWYYSSDWAHLEACATLKDTRILHSGMTVRFSAAGVCEDCAPFVGGEQWAIGKRAFKGAYQFAYARSNTSARAGDSFRAAASEIDPFAVWEGAEYEGRRWEHGAAWDEYAREYE